MPFALPEIVPLLLSVVIVVLKLLLMPYVLPEIVPLLFSVVIMKLLLIAVVAEIVPLLVIVPNLL